MKRGWDLDKAQAIVDALMLDHPLPANARPHKLSGKHENAWDAHIAPDWILVYEIDDNTLILRRTGSHADLF